MTDREKQPDLSLTVWAKTLTPQQRAAEKDKEPTGRTVDEWRRIIITEREAGRIALSPPDTKGQFRSAVISSDDIVNLLDANEGFTVFAYGFIDNKLIASKDGIGGKPAWACAMSGTELKSLKREETHNKKGRHLRKARRLRQGRSVRWYHAIASLLEESGACVGGWFSKKSGRYELNITLIFWSQEDAEHFGLRHAQEAIWEFGREIEIMIGGDGSTQWEE